MNVYRCALSSHGLELETNAMKDQVIVITGASAGIGAALARTVAKAGSKPIICARREAELSAVAKDTEALAVVADVTKRADVQRVLDEAVKKHGHVDVWVNNAGRGITRPPSQLTDEDIDAMISVNVKSVLYGMQIAAAHFKTRGKGQIVNVSSMLGRVPFVPIRAAYSGAKHFMNALTANFRMELQGSGITVTLVSPGIVATDFGLNAMHGGFDSRGLPGAQDVQEVAEVIARAIETPRADVYTRPQQKDQVLAYYSADDMAAFEQQATARR
jgi:short-subunit dehydrogenase